MTEIKIEKLEQIINNYRTFIELCSKDNDFKLTPMSEVSPYALCFGIFGYHLIGDKEIIYDKRNIWTDKIINNLDNFKDEDKIIFSKPYLQLLTFSLSALKILDSVNHPSIKNHVEIIQNYNIEDLLDQAGVKLGLPSSGNMAMFWAILLIHINDSMEVNVDDQINSWINYHRSSMNKFGFWGKSKNMNYLMFQNGYHQYEIFDYLEISGDFWNKASTNTNSLKDADSRFAPYPGGGGCYDYDALYLLTSNNINLDFDKTITDLFNSVVNSQNKDGGFCESKNVRPRNFANIRKAFKHLSSRPSGNKLEVLKRLMSIQRSRHNKIHTHWTNYSRDWFESDLWDSWFRVLLLARVDVHINKKNFKKWGFINYPGIGYHHLFKEENIF